VTIGQALTQWRVRREEWGRLGISVDGERVASEIVSDLEALERTLSSESVTIREAARLGGYSVDRLQHLVADGEIENVGRKHRPRIRRSDVPMKPGHGLQNNADRDQLSERRRIAASMITGDHT
jgi:hypothetical protein